MAKINLVVTGNAHVEDAIVHELQDRKVNNGSLRGFEPQLRWLALNGWSVKALAVTFGVSYEWMRRIVKNVAYDYNEDLAEAIYAVA